jgi:phage/plasmid-associated DNA primase
MSKSLGIVDFCEKNNILWFPIWLDVNGNEKVLQSIKHPLYNGRPKQTDFTTLTIEQIKERQTLLHDNKWKHIFEHIAMDTRQVFHIDIDTESYNEGYDNMSQLTPYFTSTTKSYGKHILVKSNDFIPENKRIQMINDDKDGVELLCGQWSYCPISNEVYNSDNEILELSNLKEMLKIDKQKIPKLKLDIPCNSPKSVAELKHDELSIDDKIFVCHLNNIGVEYINNYNDWIKIVWGVKNYNDEFKSFALNLTKKSHHYKTDDYFEKIWNEGKDKGITKGTIFYYSKKSNPDMYYEIQKENYFILTDDLFDPFKTAEIISKTLKETLILCKENWYMLNDKQLWKQQKEPSFYIINELRKYIDISNEKLVKRISQTEGEEKEKLIEVSKVFLKSYKEISKPSFLNVLTKYLKTLLTNDNFADKLDNNKGQLAFQNGIMNLETKEFREGILWSDYITDTIQYDYKPSEYSYLKSVLKKILNNNDQHLEYFLSILGFSFIGQPDLEKSIYFMIDKTENGKGDNGKTFYFDILHSLMPYYVYRSKATLIEKNNSKVHKQLAMLKQKRVVFLEEIPKDKDTNAELMKEISDGKKLENEIMFGTSETINVLFKLFALSNHIPKIDPTKESAVYNRYKQISFNSHFDRTGTRKEEDESNLLFIADVKLADKIKQDHFNEVFNIVIDYANKYYKNGLPLIPKQFLDDTKETQKENDLIAKWFDENVIENTTGKLSLIQITNELKRDKKDIISWFKEKGYEFDKGLSFKNYKRGGFKGIEYDECDD